MSLPARIFVLATCALVAVRGLICDRSVFALAVSFLPVGQDKAKYCIKNQSSAEKCKLIIESIVYDTYTIHIVWCTLNTGADQRICSSYNDMETNPFINRRKNYNVSFQRVDNSASKFSINSNRGKFISIQNANWN